MGWSYDENESLTQPNFWLKSTRDWGGVILKRKKCQEKISHEVLMGSALDSALSFELWLSCEVWTLQGAKKDV